MTASTVRSDYDALAQLSQTFGQNAENAARMLQQLRGQMDVLQGGDWIGTGASAFYREMSGDVLPTLTRLVRALESGGQTVAQISQIMKTAEDEAARQLRGEGGRAAGGAGAAPGAPGGRGRQRRRARRRGNGGPAGGGGDTGGSGGPLGGLADWLGDNAELKGDGKVFEFNFKKGNTESPFSPELAIKYGVEGSAFGDAEAADGWSAVGGAMGAKVGLDKDGPIAALYAEGVWASRPRATRYLPATKTWASPAARRPRCSRAKPWRV